MCICMCVGLELSYLWEERSESKDLRGPGKGLLVYLCIGVARTEEGVIWWHGFPDTLKVLLSSSPLSAYDLDVLSHLDTVLW